MLSPLKLQPGQKDLSCMHNVFDLCLQHSTPFTCLNSLHMHSTPFTCLHTLHMPPHPSHACTPFTCAPLPSHAQPSLFHAYSTPHIHMYRLHGSHFCTLCQQGCGGCV